ncbi:nuclear transport factor 2 family protein [Rhodococcus sp. NM-2]|uniref:nuclear transport factor 2 family protein n=1 Tax=Rhodococcus sp. NM-2 TaxID=3401174 RepID=UPI003AAB05FE
MAPDCVMEGTRPEPDGNRWTGYDECLAGWQGLASDPAIGFTVEHVDIDGDRAVIRWRITGTENYRGVNLMPRRAALLGGPATFSRTERWRLDDGTTRWRPRDTPVRERSHTDSLTYVR